MTNLPSLEKLPIKKRTDKELEEIAITRVKPVMQARAKALGTDKEAIVEKERGRGVPPEYLPKGKLTLTEQELRENKI